jgi:transposase InsO family protein
MLSGRAVGIERICREFSISRDAYYKYGKRHEKRMLTEEKVLNLIRERRKLQSREGGRKLYEGIKPELNRMGLKIGRDKLFDILRSHDMLVKPRRRYYAKTTDSRHRFNIYPNLAEGFTPTSKNQLWVSDITYIRTVNGFLYLALITDAYSRKIVGYDISDSLELEGALRALQKALSNLQANHQLIHHSDRGIQYCSHAYVNRLRSKQIRISMAAKGNCYENAMAERVNGILKQEYYLDQTFRSKMFAIKACKQAIRIYNNHRLHMSLDYKTPEYVHYCAA